MEDVEKLLRKFEDLRGFLGWAASIFVILVVIALYFLLKYLSKAIEKSAEESSEKTIRQFQVRLEKELAEHSVKFSAKHEKQVDAIHEIYIRFQRLFRLMDFMQHGDKYYQELNPHREVATLISFRTDFIKVYGLHKIVLPKSSCDKIDELIPAIENFIDTYKSGLFPEGSPLEQSEEEQVVEGEPRLYIAGIWSHGAFDEVLQKLEQVKTEIEEEFRKVYGV